MTKKKPKANTRLEMPYFICSSCGLKYGDYSVGISSYSVAICEICGVQDMCTEPRDFGYIPRWKGERWDDE